MIIYFYLELKQKFRCPNFDLCVELLPKLIQLSTDICLVLQSIMNTKEIFHKGFWSLPEICVVIFAADTLYSQCCYTDLGLSMLLFTEFDFISLTQPSAFGVILPRFQFLFIVICVFAMYFFQLGNSWKWSSAIWSFIFFTKRNQPTSNC